MYSTNHILSFFQRIEAKEKVLTSYSVNLVLMPYVEKNLNCINNYYVFSQINLWPFRNVAPIF